MGKEDRDRIKAKLRAEIEAHLMRNIDALVDKAYAAWEGSEAARIANAVSATLGRATKNLGVKERKKKSAPADSTKGCSVCGLPKGRARGKWSKPHTLEAHKKG